MAAPLPVVEVVGESYRLLFGRPGAWLVALALPLAIDVAVQLAFFAAYGPGLVRAMSFGESQIDGGMMLRMLGMQVCVLIAYVLFCIHWHRFALLGEWPRVIPVVQARHIRFLVVTIGVSLLIGLAVGIPITIIGGLGVNSSIVMILALVAAAALFVRLQLVFPAIALDRAAGLTSSWQATKGQALRLFWALLLSVLPFGLVSYLAGDLFADAQVAFIMSGEVTVGAVLSYAVGGLLGYALLGVVVGTVSGAYRRLAGA